MMGAVYRESAGMILTDLIDRYEVRFDKWRPKVGADI